MLAAICPTAIRAECKDLAHGSTEWLAVDHQYAKLERAMLAFFPRQAKKAVASFPSRSFVWFGRKHSHCL